MTHYVGVGIPDGYGGLNKKSDSPANEGTSLSKEVIAAVTVPGATVTIAAPGDGAIPGDDAYILYVCVYKILTLCNLCIYLCVTYLLFSVGAYITYFHVQDVSTK